jgi:ribosome-binding protein aMBF1 (putative translation factor)
MGLTDDIRQAIRVSGLSMSRIAEAAGLPANVVSRFVNGQRGIRLATAEKLADRLGLKLVAADGKSPSGSKRKSRSTAKKSKSAARK